MKTKDYIFIGLATVISLVIYFFSIMVSSIGGAFGHSISPGIFGPEYQFIVIEKIIFSPPNYLLIKLYM
ncbi:hypothetical protein EFM1CSP_18425, partial [Enterococcus faecium]